MAKWVAIRYSSNHIFDYVEIDDQHAIFEVEIPERWIGKSVGELDIRRKYGINILGIKRSGKQTFRLHRIRCCLKQRF